MFTQDVSLLVDVCRQCIVFQKGQDLVRCLGAIGSDPDVVLMRVKNRLDPLYDAKASAGYRDVLVNLRVETAETARLCVAGHVCEVQLLLLPFAMIKVRRLPVGRASMRRREEEGGQWVGGTDRGRAGGLPLVCFSSIGRLTSPPPNPHHPTPVPAERGGTSPLRGVPQPARGIGPRCVVLRLALRVTVVSDRASPRSRACGGGEGVRGWALGWGAS